MYYFRECNEGYFKDAGSCQAKCPEGYYGDAQSKSSLNLVESNLVHSEKTCLLCAAECETCSGPGKNECLSCNQKDNSQLKGHTCITGRPEPEVN